MADTDTNDTSGNGSTPPNDTAFTAGTDLGGDTAVEFAAADVPMDDDETLSGGTSASHGDASEDASSQTRGSGSSGGSTASGGGSGGHGSSGPTSTGEKIKEGAQNLIGQAGDKARTYVEDGKGKAAEALSGLSQTINSAAGDVDEKLGEQYGQYARSAADAVSGFSDKLKDADIDDIVEEVRDFVTKSPAIAIGAAAAIGFVLVRLIRSGLDTDTAA